MKKRSEKGDMILQRLIGFTLQIVNLHYYEFEHGVTNVVVHLCCIVEHYLLAFFMLQRFNRFIVYTNITILEEIYIFIH